MCDVCMGVCVGVCMYVRMHVGKYIGEGLVGLRSAEWIDCGVYMDIQGLPWMPMETQLWIEDARRYVHSARRRSKTDGGHPPSRRKVLGVLFPA